MMHYLLISPAVVDYYPPYDPQLEAWLKQQGMIHSKNSVSFSAEAAILAAMRQYPGVAAGPGPNIAHNLTRIDPQARVQLWTVTGNDREGALFFAGMHALGIHVYPDLPVEGTTHCFGAFSTSSGDPLCFFKPGTAGNPRLLEVDAALAARQDLIVIYPDSQSAEQETQGLRRLNALRKPGSVMAILLPAVDRIPLHRDMLAHAMIPEADVVLGNAEEFRALYAPDTDMSLVNILKMVRCKPEYQRRSLIMYATQDKEGVYVLEFRRNGDTSLTRLPASDVPMPIFSVGAGDAFASGALHALVNLPPHIPHQALYAAEMGILAAVNVLVTPEPHMIQNVMPLYYQQSLKSNGDAAASRGL